MEGFIVKIYESDFAKMPPRLQLLFTRLPNPQREEVVAAFPQSERQQGDVRGTEPSGVTKDIYGKFNERLPFTRRGEASAERRYTESGSTNFAFTPGERRTGGGSAARFFYSAKAGPDDRCDSKHPTIKPVALMRWLVRLITPPNGTVLDPFAGSGTTGVACLREGFNAILIEREDMYFKDIENRLAKFHGLNNSLFNFPPAP